AAFASVLKVHLPGIPGTLSVNYVFILLAIMEFSYPEAVVLGCIATAVQTAWGATRRTRLIHHLFNWCSMAFSVAASYGVFRFIEHRGNVLPLAIAASACTFYLGNTGLVAGVVSLTERKNAFRTWHEYYFWSFPHYLMGAAVAALVSLC